MLKTTKFQAIEARKEYIEVTLNPPQIKTPSVTLIQKIEVRKTTKK